MPRLAQLALQETALLPRVTERSTSPTQPACRLRHRRLRLVASVNTPATARTSPIPSAPAALDPLALTAAIIHGEGHAAVRAFTLDAPLGDAIVGAGDTLIVSERPPADGELALVEGLDGTRHLRRLYRDGDSLLLQPEDQSIRAERSEVNDISIIGTVITIVRRQRHTCPATEPSR